MTGRIQRKVAKDLVKELLTITENQSISLSKKQQRYKWTILKTFLAFLSLIFCRGEKKILPLQQKKQRPAFLQGIGRLRAAFFIIMEQKKRVTFYIDGFNFYFGLKRTKRIDVAWRHFYWVDIVKLCESFLGEGQILEKVIYFTASPLSPQKNSRQSAFLNANKLINGDRFEIVRGKYLEKHIICPYCKGDISRPEEKKTDVNISIRMVEDCVMGATDIVALVSADSDLVPPIELIQRRFPGIGIKVYFPPSNFSNDLKDNLIHHRSKPVLMIKNIRRFQSAVMPGSVSKDGKTYTIPDKWR